MNLLNQSKMIEATRLTRDGRLGEAMALIRSALGGAPAPVAPQGETPTAAEPLRLAFVGAPSSPANDPPPSPRPPRAARPMRPPMPDPQMGRMFDRSPAARAPSVGARFERRTYSNDAGRRDYKLYAPASLAGQARPLVVMLHGCTQSADDFAAGTRMNELAEEHNFIVAYPEQARSANASKCWNWFNTSDQQRERGEPALIAGVTREIMRDLPVDAGRVYVAGLSAGGAAAAIMGARYPDLYAAIGVHSGLTCGAANDMSSALAAMRSGAPSRRAAGARPAQAVPTIVFHGDRDSTVSPANGDHLIAAALEEMKLRATSTSGASRGGVKYTRTVYVDDAGRTIHEQWALHGVGHAWSGGSAAGSYTDPRGPDASRAFLQFFLTHDLAAR